MHARGLIPQSALAVAQHSPLGRRLPARSAHGHAPAHSRAAFCADLVRRADREQYVCALFVPATHRRTALALRAFNVETARIRESVSDANAGRVRIQWWRETLRSTDKGASSGHPVAAELSRALKATPFSAMWLHRLLDAREKNLQDRGYRTMADLEHYAENTASSLLYALLESLGVRDVHADHAASHIGKAQGIVTVLRATPFLARDRRVVLPMDVTAKFNASHQDIFRGAPTDGVRDAVFDVASTAHSHIQKSASLGKQVPRAARSVLGPAEAACEDALSRLRAANFNVFDPHVTRQNPLLPWTLAWRSLRGRFS